MNQTLREEYRIKRVMKYIGLRELSDLLDCHVANINQFENAKYDMPEDKVKKYKEYIDLHEGRETK